MLVIDSGEIMSAPRMHPSGMIEVVSNARLEGKLEIFSFGQRDDIPNPGDLMIVTTNWIKENLKVQEIEFKLRIRGRDMALFEQAAHEALLLWNDNKHWLQASMSQLGVDSRPMTKIRSADQAAAINSFYGRTQ
jgi:hypothetical protein